MTHGFINILLSRRNEQENGITFHEASGDSFLSYGELAAEAASWAAALADAGVQQNQPVLMQIAGNRDLVQAFWGAVYLGAVPTPIPPAQSPTDAGRVARAHAMLGSPFILSDGRARIDDALAESVISTKDLRVFAENTNTCLEPAQLSGDAPRLIQFSSGSTGAPKGIVVTEDNIVVGLEVTVPKRPARVKNSMLTWLPLSHNLSLIGFHVYSVFQNYSQVLMPTSSFVMNPVSWLQAITKFKPTVTACPNFAFRHVLRVLDAHPERSEGLDLSSVHKVACGSEPIDPALAADFQAELSKYGLRDNAVIAGYGLSEACLMVSVTEIYEPLHTLRLDRSRLRTGMALSDVEDPNGAEFVSVGIPVDGLDVTIRDDNGATLGEDIVGEIYISGPPVTAHVLTADGVREQSTASDGALPTGDIGLMTSGELYVVGRKKDIIFVGGKNFYSNDLERLIEDKLDIDCAVLGRTSNERGGEEIVVFPQRADGLVEEKAVRDIKSLIMRETGVPIDTLIWVDSIPTTPNGKKARHALEGLLLS